jgi:tight adherence protein C
MDTILQYFQSLNADMDAARIMFVIAAGATAFLLALGISLLVLAATDPVRRRLNQLADDVEPEHRAVARLLHALAPVNKYLLPAQERERSRTEKRLAFAGFRSANALPLFYSIKTALALIFLLAVLASSFWLPSLPMTRLVFFAAAAALVGLIVPELVLNQLVERRQKRLRDAFPDALDMLVVCVEAGLGLTASIQRVAEELRFSHPELAAELALVTAEMRAGVERETALKALATRTGLEDIHGLVSLLVQTLKFGTSVAETLRVYSEEFRDKRMQRAEEAAAKIGTKLIFPLIVCLWPAFFVVAVGPAVIRFIEIFRILGDRAGQ